MRKNYTTLGVILPPERLVFGLPFGDPLGDGVGVPPISFWKMVERRPVCPSPEYRRCRPPVGELLRLARRPLVNEFDRLLLPLLPLERESSDSRSV